MQRRNQKLQTWKRILRFAPIATASFGLHVSFDEPLYAWDEEPQILTLPPAVTISSEESVSAPGGVPPTLGTGQVPPHTNSPTWLSPASEVRYRSAESVFALFGITLQRSPNLPSPNSNASGSMLPPLPGLKLGDPVPPKSVESAPTLVTMPPMAVGTSEPHKSQFEANKFPDLPAIGDATVSTKLSDSDQELPVRIVARGVRVAETLDQDDQQRAEFRLSDRTNIRLASGTDDESAHGSVVESAQLDTNLSPPVLPTVATLPTPELALDTPAQAAASATAPPLQLPQASFTINVTPEPISPSEPWSMRTQQDVQTPIETAPEVKPGTIVLSIPSQAEPPAPPEQPERMEMTLALPKIAFPALPSAPEPPKTVPVNSAAETISALIAKDKAATLPPLPSLRPDGKPAAESQSSKPAPELSLLALTPAEPPAKEASSPAPTEPAKTVQAIQPVTTANTNLQVRKDEIREILIRGELINTDIEGGICSIVPTGKSTFAVVPLQTGAGVVQIDYRNPAGEVHRVRLALQVETAATTASSMPTALANLEKTLTEKYPGCNIRLRQGEDTLIVSGTVPTEEDAKKILMMVRKLCLVPVQDRVSVR